jgi:hypothetical protein
MQTHRRRAPPSGTYARLVSAQREARVTSAGDEYLHVCVLGEVAPYLWRATAAVERFTCARCGVCGICVACVEEQGKPLPARGVPVLCWRHGDLEREEGVALAVGEPLSVSTDQGDAQAFHQEQRDDVQQAALFG